jgi:hypothetical protein
MRASVDAAGGRWVRRAEQRERRRAEWRAAMRSGVGACLAEVRLAGGVALEAVLVAALLLAHLAARGARQRSASEPARVCGANACARRKRVARAAAARAWQYHRSFCRPLDCACRQMRGGRVSAQAGAHAASRLALRCARALMRLPIALGDMKSLFPMAPAAACAAVLRRAAGGCKVSRAEGTCTIVHPRAPATRAPPARSSRSAPRLRAACAASAPPRVAAVGSPAARVR